MRNPKLNEKETSTIKTHALSPKLNDAQCASHLNDMNSEEAAQQSPHRKTKTTPGILNPKEWVANPIKPTSKSTEDPEFRKKRWVAQLTTKPAAITRKP